MKQMCLALFVSVVLIGLTACSETAPTAPKAAEPTARAEEPTKPTSAEPTIPAVPVVELPKGSDSPLTSNKPIGTTNAPSGTPSTTPDEDHKFDFLTATISFPEPRVITVDEEFTVEATLTNGSEQDLRIIHAGKLFYFVIKDSTGKGVNTFLMHMVGINRPFEEKGTITEPYTYKLSKPGIYEISARAEFTLMDGANRDRNLEVQSAPISFEVK